MLQWKNINKLNKFYIIGLLMTGILLSIASSQNKLNFQRQEILICEITYSPVKSVTKQINDKYNEGCKSVKVNFK